MIFVYLRNELLYKMSIQYLLTLLWIIQQFTNSTGLIAYDCQNQQMKITTFSLIDIGKCQSTTDRVKLTQEKIQLVQIQDFEMLHVYQCKIHVTRSIHHCGMHSHISAVTNGLATYVHPVSRNQCLEMHKKRMIINFYHKNIDHLIINGTTHATVLMAGNMVTENSCQGAYYEDHKGSWTNVIVQAALEITLFENYATANVRENSIRLPGGISCQYKERSCIDSIYGYSFWDHVESSQCTKNKFVVLYEGLAQKITPMNNSFSQDYELPIYSVENGDTVFAMPISRPTMICGQSAFETDHPKFFIIKPSEVGTFYFEQKQVNLLNMDPTTYTNAKFVFIEKHVRGQVTKLYIDVVAQRCELEQQVLRNLQTLAVTAPAEFAYAKMKVPGYTAINYGEVIHIIECKPVEVIIRNTPKCYHELPVTWDNSSVFMAPRTHIIQKYATEIDCNPFLYPMYQVQNKWYKFSNGLHETIAPHILEPSNKNEWEYKSPHNLFAGGLYTQEDMITLQKHLVLPMERQAVTDIMNRGMIGLNTDLQGTNLRQLLDEQTLKAWFSQALDTFWNWFVTLGTVTSGAMGIFMIFKFIRFTIDTIVHGFLLYDILGFGIHLVSALFTSITMLLVHRHQKKSTSAGEEIPLREVITESGTPSAPAATTIEIEQVREAYPVLPSNDWMNN